MNGVEQEFHSFCQVSEGEHVQRTQYWFEHSWTIAEFPYDHPQTPEGEEEKTGGGARSSGVVERRRSLDYIARAMGHTGKQLKFLKSDLEGREWILLRQVINNLRIFDIQQVFSSFLRSCQGLHRCHLCLRPQLEFCPLHFTTHLTILTRLILDDFNKKNCHPQEQCFQQ